MIYVCASRPVCEAANNAVETGRRQQAQDDEMERTCVVSLSRVLGPHWTVTLCQVL